MNFKIVLLLFALTLLLAPVVAVMPNQFKQDCMQRVKRAKVILISYSYIAFRPFQDTRRSCLRPIRTITTTTTATTTATTTTTTTTYYYLLLLLLLLLL